MKHDQHIDEQFLLRELRNGNADAFEQIFKTYWQKLYTLAKSKLQSHAEAEELIQSLFSSLWEKRETLLIRDLSAYLHVSVKHMVLNNLRTRITREKYWNYYKNFLPHDAEVTAQDVSYDELSTAIEEAVMTLPEKSRAVFKMSRLEGKSNAEIANLLALSEKAIEYHLTKSMKTLKTHLRDYTA